MPAIPWPAVVALVLLAACGQPQEPVDGRSTTEVCERLLEAGVEADVTGVEDHLDNARALAEFATFAEEAADPAIAEQAELLLSQAESVLERMPPDAGDEAARRVADPMLRASVGLYATCIEHLAGEALDG